MNPTDYDVSGTGYTAVETQVSCVLTRFRVRSPWSLFRFHRAFRRIRAQAQGVPGLLQSVVLVENVHTCYTLSLWADMHAILAFNTKVHAHVSAANWSFGRLEARPDGPELWSAEFRLRAVSPHNLRWDALDIVPFLSTSRSTLASCDEP
jgi:hypothetical protein